MRKATLWLKFLSVWGLGLLLLLPLQVWAANLLSNDGLEAPFIFIKGTNLGYDNTIAHDWERFVIEEDSGKLFYFSASDWAAYNGSPVVERIDGDNAQVIWSSRVFDAGIYQQVSGLTIGEVYGFEAGILQAFETTNQTSPIQGYMYRSVGIDPYGGVLPTATTVIWSPEEDNVAYATGGNKYTWFWPGIGARAMSTTMTVFARVRSTEEATTPNSNQVWIDATFMDVAPTTTLTLTVASPTQVIASWSGQPRAGFNLYAYEAQYRRADESDWTDLQIFNVVDLPSTNTSQPIDVETGVEYVVRARTWHTEPSGAQHEVPGPWTEERVTAGGVVSGLVLHNGGEPLSGVTVGANAPLTVTTSSGSAGDYALLTGPGTVGLTATTSVGWATLEPVTVSLGITQVVPLTLTLTPPDNFIQSGGFENTLAGWNGAPGPSFVTDTVRSGRYSLRLAGSGLLSQTGVVTAMYRPTLAMWYRVAGGGGDDSMVVHIAGGGGLPPTAPLTLTTVSSGWQYLSLPLTLTDTTLLSGTLNFEMLERYSGPLLVQFEVMQSGAPAAFYLDDVSFGRAWGGPQRLYLPLIRRG